MGETRRLMLACLLALYNADFRDPPESSSSFDAIIHPNDLYHLGQEQCLVVKLQGHKIAKVNIGQRQSKPIKVSQLGQSWPNEVKSHMRRPKGMEKGNTKSYYSYEVKSSVFEAKMSEMTGAGAESKDYLNKQTKSDKAQIGSKGA